MRCTATAKTTGERCRRGAIHGGTVCKKHGGAAPQVKRRAQERLRELVHPALDRLEKAINDPKDKQGVRAARDILDRVGETRRQQQVDMASQADTLDPGRDKLTDDQLDRLIDLLDADELEAQSEASQEE